MKEDNAEKIKETLLQIYREPIYTAEIKDTFYLKGESVVAPPWKEHNKINFISEVIRVEGFEVGSGLFNTTTINAVGKIKKIEKEKNPNEIFILIIYYKQGTRTWKNFLDQSFKYSIDSMVLDEKNAMLIMKHLDENKIDFEYMRIDLTSNLKAKENLYVKKIEKNPAFITSFSIYRVRNSNICSIRDKRIINHWISFFYKFYEDVPDKGEVYYNEANVHSLYIPEKKYNEEKEKNVRRILHMESNNKSNKVFLVEKNKIKESSHEEIKNIYRWV